MIRLLQLDLEQGVSLQQLGQIGGDVQPAKGDRGADPDGASRGVRPLLDLADHPLILLEDLGALFGKGDPLLGEGDGAGMAVQQFGAHLFLQLCHLARDGRRGHILPTRHI